MVLHGVTTLPFWLAFSGVAVAWFLYMKRPDIPEWFEQKLSFVHKLLVNKYYFDKFNEIVFAGGSLAIGKVFSKFGDEKLIDGLIVNGSARTVGYVSSVIRHIQTGYLYHYAFAMIIGLIVLMGIFVF